MLRLAGDCMRGVLARVGLSVMVLAVAAVGLSASAPSLPGARVPEAKLSCTDAVQDEGDAVTLARRCHRDVEVIGERTNYTSTFVQADGNMRLESSIAAKWAKVNEVWIPVDNSIIVAGDELRVAAAVTPMTFSNGSDKNDPLATIARDGHRLTFDVPFDLPEPIVNVDQLTYSEVLPGIDLIVTVTPDATGFSEVLRVSSPEAAANPSLGAVRFPLAVSGGLEVAPVDGGFEARDLAGEVVFTSPAPAMWDSAAPNLDSSVRSRGGEAGGDGEAVTETSVDFAGIHEEDRAVNPVDGDTVVALPAQLAEGGVVIVPDSGMLSSPDTVWPVYIDPSVSGGLQQYAAVRTAFTTKTGWTDEGVGLCHHPTVSACNPTFASRLLYRFVGLDQIGAVDPGNVIAATFSAVETHSYDCTARPVELYRVADFNSSTVGWDGGFGTLQSTQTVAAKDSCPGQPVRWIEFNALEGAQAVASVNASAISLGLHANESSMAYWKRFRWDAQFSVVYNRPPNLPFAASMNNPTVPCVTGSDRPFVRTMSPILVASASDPDGDSIYTQFDIIDTQTWGRVWGPVNTGGQASGSQFAVQVGASPLADGHTYQWRVYGIDLSYGWAGPAVGCEFTVDTSRPTRPTVTTVAGQPAVYSEGQANGGLGLAGAFVISPGSTSDVVAYKYSFNSDSLGATVPVALGASMTLPFTPTVAGAQVLNVASVDRAGNVSDTRSYAFIVKFPGVWRLDEGNGTSAAGTGSTGQRFPLTVSPSTTWVDGMLTASGFSTTDKALAFNETSDVASTAGAVVATDVGYSVMAFVTTDVTTGTATAVSQDGTQVSTFELGIISDAACPTGTGTCWAFTASPTDAASPAPVRAMSSVPVQSGRWYHLVGIRSNDKIQVSVCEIGPANGLLVNPKPVVSAPTPFTSTWNGTGAMKVGRGMTSANAAHPWRGVVDNVQVMDGPASIAKLRTSCAQVE